MDILHVPAKIATLRERFATLWALKRSLTCMLSEMVSKIATFLEDTIASLVLTFEEQFDTLSLFIFYLDGFVPIIWNSNEAFSVSLFLFKI